MLAAPPGAIAVALLNRGTTGGNITADLTHVAAAAAAPRAAAYDVLDIWQNESSLGIHTDELSAHVPGTSAAFYKLVPHAQGDE